ncbi:alternative ribosome rescue aminoacyl-tRNA hydrolase ArfB [Litorihabitans aurantiacus]|uniref:alternative ribosome rescue aminoacyl-tRNA hydrolase ArfB n=1 Tax=Litorihabitans aurantiacus TaxID=1930061 RepID=UPI0024E11CEF|nr:alternative ribosome rescue aminoacyl-tRNA hydrolase ArfB [Litorihabitans aurantiacus]
MTATVVIPGGELLERFSRSSGPGGQGVNITDSRVELRLNVARTTALPEPLRERLLARLAPRLVDGVLTVTASENRAQLSNRRAAHERMTAILAEAARPPGPRRRATRATRGSQERRLAGKKQRGAVKRNRGRVGGRGDW